ncbi:unnamed protein product [Rotaria sp. Silwood1]|nr:unnamed protein product [Rotaria sp. Silwood1]CAF1533881.1 unnamed protein product [Rotaria sp. Silwood1]CAF1689955.1 unnamed protein product [Rotaria sp. Silwood1]CAF1689960.1 unnamed protein product [Rotaria sp. Silwood1]
MTYVHIYDSKKKHDTYLFLKQDNIIQKDYFIGTFPGATGILYKNEQLNGYVSIPRDSDGNFQFEWDQNVVYQLIYVDDYRNRSSSSPSSSSNRWELLDWLRVVGGLFKSPNSNSHYKKTI